VFGMGTGVSLAPWAPITQNIIIFRYDRCPSLRTSILEMNKRFMTNGLLALASTNN
jgi:hypothetical protein